MMILLHVILSELKAGVGGGGGELFSAGEGRSRIR